MTGRRTLAAIGWEREAKRTAAGAPAAQCAPGFEFLGRLGSFSVIFHRNSPQAVVSQNNVAQDFLGVAEVLQSGLDAERSVM
jgi:hypothetical protein